MSLYPDVMVSSTNSAYNLTVANAASSNYALTVMTVVALIFTPLVLAYQAWSYYVFRARVQGAAPPRPIWSLRRRRHRHSAGCSLTPVEIAGLRPENSIWSIS